MTTQSGLKLLNEKYNIPNGWKYAGGGFKKVYSHDNDYELQETRHTRYFNTLKAQWREEGFSCERDYFPSHKRKCICEHGIEENCYIYKRVQNIVEGKITEIIHLRVLGNCCINKLDLQGRRCALCGEVHKNRNDNFCNDCRIINEKEEKWKKKMATGWYCHCGQKKLKQGVPQCLDCYLKKIGKKV